MSNVINIDDKIPKPKHFVAQALCLHCDNTWIAVVGITANLFALECPRCNNHTSFVSFFPAEYIQELNAKRATDEKGATHENPQDAT